MEIKIPKEVRLHKETLFFGLSARQFFCSVLAVGMAVGVYFLLKDLLGRETASWLCILSAAPLAVAGFFQYNGLTFEQFVWAFIKLSTLFKNVIFRRNRMSFFAGQHTGVYSLNYRPTCRLEARQVLIYQCILDLTGENDKYNYSKAAHLYPLLSYSPCSAKNYKIASALTQIRDTVRPAPCVPF